MLFTSFHLVKWNWLVPACSSKYVMYLLPLESCLCPVSVQNSTAELQFILYFVKMRLLSPNTKAMNTMRSFKLCWWEWAFILGMVDICLHGSIWPSSKLASWNARNTASCCDVACMEGRWNWFSVLGCQLLWEGNSSQWRGIHLASQVHNNNWVTFLNSTNLFFFFLKM